MEQAKFTYYLLGKAFEMQIKKIEHQVEKQIKTLEEHGKQLVEYSKEKEPSIYENIVNKIIEEIKDLS